MDLLSLAKSLEALGMVGLSLAIASGLAWLLLKREQDGMNQLKSSIEGLSRAIEALNTNNTQTAAFLQTQSTKSEAMAKDVKELKDDVGLIKVALISVGVKSLTKD
jgi:hypothetical protein